MDREIISSQYIDYLFQSPEKWGLRGDPYLWRWLRNRFKDENHHTYTPEAFIEEIYRHLEGFGLNIKDCRDPQNQTAYVKAFDHQGMSGGGISGNFWHNRAIPLITSRINAIANGLYFKKAEKIKELLFIGDTHGQLDKLNALLEHENYDEYQAARDGSKIVFLGDLIDNKPDWRADHAGLLDKIKQLVENKLAYCIMGNHEFNAIGWSLKKSKGHYCRSRRKASNRIQHQLFLDQIGQDTEAYYDWINWFKSLPLYLDFGEVRAIHACWHQPSIDKLAPYLNADKSLKDEYWFDAFDPECELYHLIETVLKGPEIKLPRGRYILDKNQTKRTHVRIAWWKHPNEISKLGDLCLTPNYDDKESFWLPLTAEDLIYNEPQAIPVIIGHYTLESETPSPVGDKTICVDFNAAKPENPLIGYKVNLENWQRMDDLVFDGYFCSIHSNPTDYSLNFLSDALSQVSYISSPMLTNFQRERFCKIIENRLSQRYRTDYNFNIFLSDRRIYLNNIFKIIKNNSTATLATYLNLTKFPVSDDVKNTEYEYFYLANLFIRLFQHIDKEKPRFAWDEHSQKLYDVEAKWSSGPSKKQSNMLSRAIKAGKLKITP